MTITINLTPEDRDRLLEIQRELTEIRDRCGVDQLDVEAEPRWGNITFRNMSGRMLAWAPKYDASPPSRFGDDTFEWPLLEAADDE